MASLLTLSPRPSSGRPGPPSGKEILQQIDINGDNEITIDEFSDLMESHMYILAPAFDLQRALRQRLLGVKYW